MKKHRAVISEIIFKKADDEAGANFDINSYNTAVDVVFNVLDKFHKKFERNFRIFINDVFAQYFNCAHFVTYDENGESKKLIARGLIGGKLYFYEVDAFREVFSMDLNDYISDEEVSGYIDDFIAKISEVVVSEDSFYSEILDWHPDITVFEDYLKHGESSENRSEMERFLQILSVDVLQDFLFSFVSPAVSHIVIDALVDNLVDVIDSFEEDCPRMNYSW